MSDPEPSVSYRSLLLLLGAVVAAWAASGYLLHAVPDRGTFGDMFGAVNALFTGLAFAALIYTIVLQRRDLQLQREELKLTREELRGQKNQLIAQNDVLRLQAFETTFFQLLRVLNDTVAAIDLNRANGQRTHGRDCFSVFYSNLRGRFVDEKSKFVGQATDEIIEAAYIEFYAQYHGDVGHYFRTLYNIVKFVHRSPVEDRRFYTNLVRAQLSSQELLLLFYNCQSSLGRNKFRPLIETYALLKTVPKNLLLDPLHESLYSQSAYGDD